MIGEMHMVIRVMNIAYNFMNNMIFLATNFQSVFLSKLTLY